MRTTKGFSIIEVIVVLVILATVFVASYPFLSAAFTSYFQGVSYTGLNQEASIAMLRLSDELKKAISFSVINSTQVTFTTVDGNTVSYSWTTPTLTRTGTSAQPISKSITAFSLSYYQSNYTTTATLTAVRAVTISATFSNGNESIPLINTIYLQNMR